MAQVNLARRTSVAECNELPHRFYNIIENEGDFSHEEQEWRRCHTSPCPNRDNIDTHAVTEHLNLRIPTEQQRQFLETRNRIRAATEEAVRAQEEQQARARSGTIVPSRTSSAGGFHPYARPPSRTSVHEEEEYDEQTYIPVPEVPAARVEEILEAVQTSFPAVAPPQAMSTISLDDLVKALKKATDHVSVPKPAKYDGKTKVTDFIKDCEIFFEDKDRTDTQKILFILNNSEGKPHDWCRTQYEAYKATHFPSWMDFKSALTTAFQKVDSTVDAVV